MIPQTFFCHYQRLARAGSRHLKQALATGLPHVLAEGDCCTCLLHVIGARDSSVHVIGARRAPRLEAGWTGLQFSVRLQGL